MVYRVLGATGLNVSALGFGASPLGGIFHQIDEADGERAVHTALDLGVNFFDVSPFYGDTRAEAVLGQALTSIPRSRYILATKIGRYGQHDFDFTPARIRRSIDESLQRLHVEHVDLLQCHDIEFVDATQIVEETIPALRQLVITGKARFVGITGFPLKIFQAVIEKVAVDTVLSYCRYTLADTSLEALLRASRAQHRRHQRRPACHGITHTTGAAGLAPHRSKSGRDAQKQIVTARKGVDIAKLAIQFAVAHPHISTTLVGISSVNEIVRNVHCASEPPDQELLSAIRRILSPIHNQSWPSGRPEYN